MTRDEFMTLTDAQKWDAVSPWHRVIHVIVNDHEAHDVTIHGPDAERLFTFSVDNDLPCAETFPTKEDALRAAVYMFLKNEKPIEKLDGEGSQ